MDFQPGLNVKMKKPERNEPRFFPAIYITKLSLNLLGQCRHIPDEDTVPGEINLICFPKIIQYGGYGLAAGTCIICNVLLCQGMLQQCLKSNLASASPGIVD